MAQKKADFGSDLQEPRVLVWYSTLPVLLSRDLPSLLVVNLVSLDAFLIGYPNRSGAKPSNEAGIVRIRVSTRTVHLSFGENVANWAGQVNLLSHHPAFAQLQHRDILSLSPS